MGLLNMLTLQTLKHSTAHSHHNTIKSNAFSIMRHQKISVDSWADIQVRYVPMCSQAVSKTVQVAIIVLERITESKNFITQKNTKSSFANIIQTE
jgi:hypothetical protein